MTYCGNCGNKMEADEHYCGNCGAYQGDNKPPIDTSGVKSNSSMPSEANMKRILTIAGFIGVLFLITYASIFINNNSYLGSQKGFSLDSEGNLKAVNSIIKVPQDYSTIQEAIDNSENGHIIIVDEGVYHENINLQGKNIRLQSKDPDNIAVVKNTIIKGVNGSVVIIESGEDRNAVIAGFTISGGNGKQNTYTVESYDGTVLTFKRNYGGGIYISNSSPTITGNIISENRVRNVNKNDIGVGGGIAILYHSSPLLTDNIISNNYSEGYGGGIAVWYNSKPVLSNNTIDNNRAGDIGGGLMISLMCGPEITSNIITGNQAVWGGGVYVAHMSDASIKQNIIKNNSADLGAGVFLRKIDKTMIIGNEFLANEANLEGSVLHLNTSASATFINNHVENNHAPSGGDTIKIEKGSMLIIANPDNNTYKNNTP